MSEYQYYEFVALDRPLTNSEMAELRSVSTRADISPTGFRNEYNWGDLKADPAKLLARYFDAHLYFANWGTHRLMFRFPSSRFDLRRLKPYFPGGPATLERSGNQVVIDSVQRYRGAGGRLVRGLSARCVGTPSFHPSPRRSVTCISCVVVGRPVRGRCRVPERTICSQRVAKAECRAVCDG